MVGDSTMRGMSTTAQAVIRSDYNLAFDSGSCRRLIVASCKPIPNAISVIRANPGMDAIVIMTGYNDWKVGDAVEAIMAEAARQGVSYVVWLTYRTDIVEGAQKPIAISQVFREHNQELAAKAPLHPTLKVLDWDGYSAGHDDWSCWDGFHLANPGGFALANLLKATLDGLPLGGASRRPRPARPQRHRPGSRRRRRHRRACRRSGTTPPRHPGRRCRRRGRPPRGRSFLRLGLAASGAVAAGTRASLSTSPPSIPAASGS